MPLALPIPIAALVALAVTTLLTTPVVDPDITGSPEPASAPAVAAVTSPEAEPAPEPTPQAENLVAAGAPPLDVPVTPSLVPGTISGYVSDAAGHVAGALVTVYAVPSGAWVTQTWTAADGGYLTEPLGAGSYTVRFSAADHRSEFFDDAGTLAEATPVEIAAASADPVASAVLDISWGVEGIVSSPSGAPIGGAEVQLVDGGGISQAATVSGIDGRYELVAPTAGPWTVLVIPPSDGLHHTTWFPHDLTAATADVVSIPAGGGVATADVTLYAVPLAAPDAFAGVSDAPIERGEADGLLANDTGGVAPLEAVLADSPAHGALVFYATGSFRYTPFPGFDGVDTFSYTLIDAVGLESDEATVTLTIAADPLIPADDHYVTAFETELQIDPAGVLANDSGAPTTATLDEQPQHGTVDLDADGGFRYAPDAGFSGADAFSYRIGDGQGTSDIAATVTIEVAPPVEEPGPDVPTLASTGSAPFAAIPVIAGILLLGVAAILIGRRRAA